LAKPPKILVLNGPNLNLLGEREPAIYGRDRLADIEKACAKRGKALGLAVDFRQSNHEGELIEWIQAARKTHAGIVINPGGLTHSSVALLDALIAADRPVIEVHLSNIFRREPFRQHSYVSRAAVGVISGLGKLGYLMALEALAGMLKTQVEV
jgi:3-dehydroquinate dehydratase II